MGLWTSARFNSVALFCLRSSVAPHWESFVVRAWVSIQCQWDPRAEMFIPSVGREETQDRVELSSSQGGAEVETKVVVFCRSP